MMVSDEEKRWLVVGIAMIKVAAPVLRDFIKQGMDTHYTNMDIYCSGLATPCTLKTLTYHQVSTNPCFEHFKFQNINNNLQLYGMKKKDLHKYNYNINSSVDLAKLFLPDYLAEFSGFDDSLDMSAILRLLGFNNPAPIFHSPNPLISIQSSADEVRKNVRNTWGHCNVTDWTEVFFNDCFSKLTTLLRSLGLTGDAKKTTLDQLSDWQTKGCQLCMGNAVDKDLLSLVQREVKGIIAELESHNARLDAVGTKLKVDEEARREATSKILERVEELLRRLAGVEKRVEGVEQSLAETNIKVVELGQDVTQLQDSLTDKVEQLAHEIKSQKMEDFKPAAAPADAFDVKTCRSKLAKHYKRTATVPTSVWSKKSPVDIHKIYTRLSWVKKEQTPAGSSRSELGHYTDVFTENKNGVVPKRILVQGQTGIGKSTFVKKLAVDWAERDDATTGDKQQKDILQTFELLVVVNLKEVSKCRNLKDVISCSSIFAREEKHLTDSLLNYITNNQDKVLLVFDGYDEYRCGSNSEIYEIFSGSVLRNCCVLITTRISKADELRAFKDVHAEITGFSEEDRVDFMSKMLGGKAEAMELSHHLDRQILNGLNDLAKVPLLLLFFCTLWKKGKSKSFPESKTKLYLAMVQYVLDYNQGKDSPARFGKVHDFKDVLSEIGKVALECLLKDDHVFEYDQLSAAVLCDESLIIGLLQVSEYAENLRPAGMVSFIHKSIQEFLAAWFISYRCVPEGNLGGIEQHTRTLEDCEAWENIFQFVCGLSDDAAVKVFQHLTSVRISDPTLDLSNTIPDAENETDVPLCYLTNRHVRFIRLVDDFFQEVQSQVALVRHWLDCTAGVILIVPYFDYMSTMAILNEGAFCKAFFLFSHPCLDAGFRVDMSMLHKVLKFFDVLHAPKTITENSSALSIDYFLMQFNNVECELCCFDWILGFHNGKAQLFITDLTLHCDDHARPFTDTIAISTSSPSENSFSKQTCLKFLRSLKLCGIVNAQAFKNLAAVFRNCDHLKTIGFAACEDGMCELLDQIPSPSTCSLKIGWDRLVASLSRFLCELNSACSLTSVEAEKLSGVLPRFNKITILNLSLANCCAAAVNKLVCSITHKTLKELTLKSANLTPVAAEALGRSLPEMLRLRRFRLTGVDGRILQEKEMELLFGGINKAYPSLEELYLGNFNARGSLAPFTKRVRFFPYLNWLNLQNLNMDECDLHGLLENLRSLEYLWRLELFENPLGSWDTVQCIVKQTLPRVDLLYQ